MNESPSLRTLYPEKQGDPIARDIRALRQHALDIPAHPNNPDDIPIPSAEKIKRELYALSAFIIEQVHPQALSILEAAGPGLKVYERFKFPPETDFLTINLERSLVKESEEFFSDTARVQDVYPTAFLDALQIWSAACATESRGYNARARQRIEDLLAKTNYRADIALTAEKKEVYPEHLIMRGTLTAAETSWSIMRAIPIAFHTTYNRTITPEEFRQIANSAERLTVQLSSLHIDSLNNLSDFAEMAGIAAPFPGLEFPIELFAVERGDDGAYRLVFDPNSIENYQLFLKHHNRSPSEEERLGCPARDARTRVGGKQVSIVSSVYEFHQRLAEKYLVPNLAKYTEGALESAQE